MSYESSLKGSLLVPKASVWLPMQITAGFKPSFLHEQSDSLPGMSHALDALDHGSFQGQQSLILVSCRL